ncbi:superoxide dismutase [Flavobacterium haoranii]|uniref:Superoxide dismutase n=1 Tax=Flavobacterium haoranii TaxID=683124 RepID=A0A1M6LA63_9FLAO|nr:superoxide dismutase [Flavobacterium haoranii]SHJ68052.1 superoxide dismutase, Fe-Mn family [Flavobacterium haoranii]
MKKLILSLTTFLLLLISCKQDNNLVEVQIPEPEEPVSTLFTNPSEYKASGTPFKLFEITYKFDDFSDCIEGKTLENHYSKVYLNFANNLNNLVTEKRISDWKVSQICRETNPEEKQLLHVAGGFYNHTLFFENLTKEKLTPSDTLQVAINRDFGSFENFKNDFTSKAESSIGSNWVWLILDKDHKLQNVLTKNEENPLMKTAEIKGTPLLCLDLWEHAYLTNNKIGKKAYIENFFNYIDWKKISTKYEDLLIK